MKTIQSKPKKRIKPASSSRLEQQARLFKRREVDFERKIAALEGEIIKLSETASNREHQLQLVYSSRSWRITQPLRKIFLASHPIRYKFKLGTKLRYLRQRLRKALGPSYGTLCKRQAAQLELQSGEIRTHIRLMHVRPSFTVIIDARAGSRGLKATIRSIRDQLYPSHSIQVLMGVNATLRRSHGVKGLTSISDLVFAEAPDNFIVLLEAGQCLTPNALYEFASSLNAGEYDLIYGDEDSIDRVGRRHSPFYKPAWSPDYLETFNYIGFTACFRASLIADFEWFSSSYDLVLSFTEQPRRILHIAQVLGNRTADDRSRLSDVSPLQRRLARTGRKGLVRPHKNYSGCYDIQIELSSKPLISIVIPTAGKTIVYNGRAIDLITNVVREIKEKSSYKDLEFIIVHNENLNDQQLAKLSDFGCRLISFSSNEFNIPKKLNLGAKYASGEFVLLMNDDIEIIEPSWIERLLEHFEKPSVGVVGARLVYPDGKLQHAGVVHNYGNPDHVRRMYDGEESGYFYSTCGARNYLAVTGAVMLTRATTYRQVGGYSEKLAVSFNDVDYCLKVRELGLSTVYASAAKLIHLESQSRIPTLNVSELVYFHATWGSQTNPDPYYNENFLAVAPPTFIPTINAKHV